MRFSTATLCAALVSVVLGAPSTENPINKPDGIDSIIAGEPYTIKWTPTTEGTIKLTLRQGPSDDLKDLEVITSDADNSGAYEWTPSADLPAGDDYAIMITSEAGDDNYTPLLKISSDAEPKPKPTSSKDSEEEEEDSPKPTKSGEHKAHITGSSNSTITSKKYSNSTATKTKSSSPKTTLEPSTTGEDDSVSETASASVTAAPDSGAMAVVRSPIALVACLAAGFFFLN